MEIQITAIKFEVVNGQKTGKSFAFKLDPKKMAVYKTEATLRKKIDEYVLKNKIFKKEDIKDLKYNMREFITEWKKQKRILSSALEASTNNTESYYNECVGDKALENLVTHDVKFLCGAIAGDIIGSVYEFEAFKERDFPLFLTSSVFTDDTVMTVANADWLLAGGDLTGIMKGYGNRFQGRGYGGMFRNWLREDEPKPYNSWGNGSAMRVSPVGWAFDTLEETLEAAKQSAEITHNHPEGIKGAQATAACVFLARTGKSKERIKEYIEKTFGYNLSRTCDEIRPTYKFDGSCQGSVPESIVAFLESTDFESAVRLAVSLGGDADTMGAITGGIAEAYYGGVPEHIRKEVLKRLPLKIIRVMQNFYHKFIE